MVILGLETVTRAGSLAIFDHGTCAGAIGDASRTHGARLPAELLAFAAAHGHDLTSVDFLAVVSGPGSFTGLRIGIAAVQGLALVTGTRVIPVPTLEALASGWLDAAGISRVRLVPCVDGARGDVFMSAYDVPGVDRLEAATELIQGWVGAPDAAAALLSALPGDSPLLIVGEGGRRYAASFQSVLPAVVIDERPVPLASAAVRLAARRTDLAVSPHALKPVYVRRPDAELARERARAGRSGGR